jgi:hypothetical protein
MIGLPPENAAGCEPRATKLHLPHRSDLRAEIWMGGIDSVIGEPIGPDDLATAVVVDCAGDLPDPLRLVCGLYVPRVFMDAEVRPYSYPRLAGLVHDLAALASGADEPRSPGYETAAGRLSRIYMLCQYGMNRSGLVTGLLLRALGEEPEAALAQIRQARPGAMSNQTFCSLVENWSCPEGG